MGSLRALCLACLALGATRGVRAEPAAAVRLVPGADQTLTLAADLDDDDEDGVPDGEQVHPDDRDAVALVLPSDGPVRVTVSGPLALLRDGRRITGPVELPAPAAARLALLGVVPGEGVVRVEGTSAATLHVQVAALRVLDAKNRALSPTRDALAISRHVTHDPSLPRDQAFARESGDDDNLRLELHAPGELAPVLFARLEARGASAAAAPRVLRHVPMLRGPEGRYRSPFVRLVSDATDESAPEVSPQLLRVHLRDRVEVVVDAGGRAYRTTLRVGRPGRAGGPRAVLQGTLRMTVLRSTPGGPPVLGADDTEAVALARSQVEIANEIWAQCFVTFGAPEDTEVRLVDPPPPALLAIGDIDGLPARGGGAITFRADGVRIGPVPTRAGAAPDVTARDVVRALEARGFRAELSINPRTEMGAGMGADIVVRTARGVPVTLSGDPAAPLSSDPQQRVAIGMVDLVDGIQEFDNALAATGTLEERTLLKLLTDRDPTTVDVILINHFVNRDRQGEAFIEADGSSMANMLVFDRNAVRYDRQAWVQAHELGHVLLDEAFHPDSIGPDAPWLLMDSDAQRGRVTGPKRLRPEDCARVRRRSGPGAHPALLRPAP